MREDFFEDYLGMRCESVDMTELVRRMNEEIYDKEEFEKAMEGIEGLYIKKDLYPGRVLLIK